MLTSCIVVSVGRTRPRGSSHPNLHNIFPLSPYRPLRVRCWLNVFRDGDGKITSTRCLNQTRAATMIGVNKRMQKRVAEAVRQNADIKTSVQAVRHVLKTVGTDIVRHVDHLEEGGLIGFCVTFALYLIMFICWYRTRTSSTAIPTTIESDNRPNPALHRSQRYSNVDYVVSTFPGNVELKASPLIKTKR